MSSIEEMNVGKRFAAFILAVLLVAIGYALNHSETFGVFANIILGLFGLYVAGQSATDWQKAKTEQAKAVQE